MSLPLRASLLLGFLVLWGCDQITGADEDAGPFTIEGDWILEFTGVPIDIDGSGSPTDCHSGEGARVELSEVDGVISGTHDGIGLQCWTTSASGMGAGTVTGVIRLNTGQGDRVDLTFVPDVIDEFTRVVELRLNNGLVIPPQDTPGGAVFYLDDNWTSAEGKVQVEVVTSPGTVATVAGEAATLERPADD